MYVFWLLMMRDIIAFNVAMMAAPYDAAFTAVEGELERHGVAA